LRAGLTAKLDVIGRDLGSPIPLRRHDGADGVFQAGREIDSEGYREHCGCCGDATANPDLALAEETVFLFAHVLPLKIWPRLGNLLDLC
jgi:hypothetical protein